MGRGQGVRRLLVVRIGVVACLCQGHGERAHREDPPVQQVQGHRVRATGGGGRQDEFALSRRAGASPALVHRSTLIESVAVLAIAFALGAAVVAVVWTRLAQNFVATGLGIAPGAPGMLGWFVLARSVMALVATVGGTAWALRAIRVE